MTQMPRSYSDFGVRQQEFLSENAKVALRFFNMVYAWMAAGLAVTALVAAVVSQRPTLLAWAYNPVALIGSFIVQLALVVMISSAVNRLSAAAATALFLVYAALVGFTFSVLFVVFAHATLFGAFLATAGTFAATSVYGMVTRTDLTRFRSLFIMGLIGFVIASLVNVFFAQGAMTWILNYVGVALFVGLTAYDTQKLKQIAYATANDARMASRLAVNGALELYLDFINLFLLLLRILSDRR